MPKLLQFPVSDFAFPECFTDGTQFHWRTGTSGLLEEIGDEWTIITGQPAEGAMGFGWTGMIHPEDIHRMLRMWYCSQVNITPFRCPFRLLTISGDYVEGLSIAEPVFNLQGSISHWQGQSVVKVEIPRRVVNFSR